MFDRFGNNSLHEFEEALQAIENYDRRRAYVGRLMVKKLEQRSKGNRTVVSLYKNSRGLVAKCTRSSHTKATRLISAPPLRVVVLNSKPL